MAYLGITVAAYTEDPTLATGAWLDLGLQSPLKPKGHRMWPGAATLNNYIAQLSFDEVRQRAALASAGELIPPHVYELVDEVASEHPLHISDFFLAGRFWVCW